MQRQLWTFLSATLAGLLLVAVATPANAQALGPVHRFSAEFQFTSDPLSVTGPEIVTNLPPALTPPGAGGKVVYRKTLFIPYRTLFFTFSATGDTHGGAALLMTCLVDGVVCQSGGGLVTAGPSGWITLQKMPAGHTGTNCNDGSGGTGDCHDNNLNYTWCTTVDGPGPRTVELKLASSIPGGLGREVFYERSHIYIDATPNKNADDGCVPAAFVPGSNTIP